MFSHILRILQANIHGIYGDLLKKHIIPSVILVIKLNYSLSYQLCLIYDYDTHGLITVKDL